MSPTQKASNKTRSGKKSAGKKSAGKTAVPKKTAAKPVKATAPRKRKPEVSSARKRRVLVSLVALSIWIGIGLVGYLGFHAWHLPDPARLQTPGERPPHYQVVDQKGTILMASGDVHGTPVALADLPDYVPKAFLALEDRRYYSHFGVDPIGILRAAWANLKAWRTVEGGSTITQQLAKNLFLTPERSFTRKIREALLSFWLEQKFTKDQLLEIYLNRIYLGAGAYGIDAAARQYFGVPAPDLSLWQAAVLSGLPKAPSRLNPQANQRASAKRARLSLQAMLSNGWITDQQLEQAQSESGKKQVAPKASAHKRLFAEWALDQAAGRIGPLNQDLRIETGLDPALQAAAEATLKAIYPSMIKAGASEMAFVAINETGDVQAMIGGVKPVPGGFNRAVKARRQPGSAFKLFVYLAALEQGISPADLVEDSPVAVGSWQPSNFQGRYAGIVPLTEAFAKSANAATVRLFMQAGADQVIGIARRLGIASPLTDMPALSLGAAEVTLLEMVAAYGAVAANGRLIEPRAFQHVRQSNGHSLLGPVNTASENAASESSASESSALGVLAPRVAEDAEYLLAAVVREGTGRAAYPQSWQAHQTASVYGKTGTSQDSRDAWFIGYIHLGEGRFLSLGVWMGNDQGTPAQDKNGKGLTGGGLPAKFFRLFAEKSVGK